MTAYETAKERYAELGIDTEAAMALAERAPVALHGWEMADEAGFEHAAFADADGRNPLVLSPRTASPDDFMREFRWADRLIPGKKKLTLLASFRSEADPAADRDAIEPRHYAGFVDFAREMDIGLNFNSEYICHQNAADRLSLSHPDKAIRDFWVAHGCAARRVAAYMARETGKSVVHNIWVIDGYRTPPADRLSPRVRLCESLDRIFAEPHEGVIDALEPKHYSAGLEGYTVGSYDLYYAYALAHKGVYPLFDNGHFHPGEELADKISAAAPVFDQLPFHFTRHVSWDSEHTVVYDDELRAILGEIVACGALPKAHLGLDYYDVSLERTASWVIGARSVKKALLYALLTPHAAMAAMQAQGDFTSLLAMRERLAVLPFGDVWDQLCLRAGVPGEAEWFAAYKQLEKRA